MALLLPFRLRAAMITPPLSTKVSPVPARNVENAQTSVVTRVVQPLKHKCRLEEGDIPALVDAFMADHELNHLVIEPMEFEEWVSRYPRGIAGKLRRARDRETFPFASSAAVAAFIKIEAGITDPRNISPRLDLYRAWLGPYSAAVDNALCGAKWLIKGMTIPQRDVHFRTLFGQHGRGKYVETDYSRFDSTIQPVLMRLRNEIYARILAQHPEIKIMLEMQILTKGQLYGIAYITTGLSSGDPTTSTGNGITNRFATWYALRDAPYPWVAVHEGDDGIINVPEGRESDASERLETTAIFLGLILKLVFGDLCDVGFCGRWLTDTPEGIVSCCNLLRTIPKLHITTANYDTTSNGRTMDHLAKLALAKAMSYQATDYSTPIVSDWCRAVFKEWGHLRPAKLARWEQERLNLAKESGLRPCVVNYELRSFVYYKMGLTPAAQLNYADEIASVGINYLPIQLMWEGKENPETDFISDELGVLGTNA